MQRSSRVSARVSPHTSTQLVFAALLSATTVASVAATSAHAAVGDGDNDGIADAADAFPCDADISSVAFVPGQNAYASLYVEDQWPSQGDYDFNDLVLDYNVELYKNAAGNVKSLRLSYTPRAVGASFNNGAAVHLPLTLASVSGVQITRKVGSGSATTVNPIAGETDLVINIASDIRNELSGGVAGPINTIDANAATASQSVEINVTFATPIALSAALAPFDVFLYRTGEYGHQIHRPQFAGTAQMRQDLFGTLDDGSNASKKFVDQRGVPFMLDVPTSAAFPKEGVRIDALFPDIVAFGLSSGSSNTNFFNTNVDNSKAYSKLANIAAFTPSIFARVADQSCVNTSVTVAGNITNFITNLSCPIDGVRVGDDLYYLEYGNGRFSKRNLITNQTTLLQTFGGTLRGITHLNNILYIGFESGGVIARYNLLSNSAMSNFASLSNPGELATDGTFIYSTSYGANQIRRYDPATGAVLATVGASTPYGLDFDNGKLYAAELGTNTAGEYTGNPLARVRTAVTHNTQPIGIAVSGDNVYVSSHQTATIGRYSLSTGQLLNTYNTQSYGMYVDSVGKQIFLFDCFGNAIKILK